MKPFMHLILQRLFNILVMSFYYPQYYYQGTEKNKYNDLLEKHNKFVSKYNAMYNELYNEFETAYENHEKYKISIEQLEKKYDKLNEQFDEYVEETTEKYDKLDEEWEEKYSKAENEYENVINKLIKKHKKEKDVLLEDLMQTNSLNKSLIKLLELERN